MSELQGVVKTQPRLTSSCVPLIFKAPINLSVSITIKANIKSVNIKKGVCSKCSKVFQSSDIKILAKPPITISLK